TRKTPVPADAVCATEVWVPARSKSRTSVQGADAGRLETRHVAPPRLRDRGAAGLCAAGVRRAGWREAHALLPEVLPEVGLDGAADAADAADWVVSRFSPPALGRGDLRRCFSC